MSHLIWHKSKSFKALTWKLWFIEGSSKFLFNYLSMNKYWLFIIFFVFRYKCEDCEYQGKSKTHLRAHVQWAHKNKGHKCKLCDFTAMYQAGNIHDKDLGCFKNELTYIAAIFLDFEVLEILMIFSFLWKFCRKAFLIFMYTLHLIVPFHLIK